MVLDPAVLFLEQLSNGSCSSNGGNRRASFTEWQICLSLETGFLRCTRDQIRCMSVIVMLQMYEL